MSFEYLSDAKEQLTRILGSVDEFEDQLTRLASSAGTLRIATRPLTPGLSGASVFLVTRLVGDSPLVPLVVKAADSVPLIRQERDNYERYVASKLQSAPALLDSGSSRLLVYEFGGALAAFNPETLRTGYSRASAKALAKLMERIVQAMDVLHRTSVDTVSCAERVQFSPPLAEKLNNLPYTIAQNSIDELLACLALLDNQRARFPAKSMTGHGDLNAGNVLFEPGAEASYPVFIDFASIERSKDNFQYPEGQHFPFWDFAKLERDLKTRLFLKEAIAEGLDESSIVSIVRDVDEGRGLTASLNDKSAQKLHAVVSQLRESVRLQHAPTLYLACYKLSVAYATLSVLYRTQQDEDIPQELQGRVAIESALALLQTCLSIDLGGRVGLDENDRQSDPPTVSPAIPSVEIDPRYAERAQMLLLRLYDFKGTCIVGRAKGEDEHLRVPGHIMDMQWGAGNEDERLAWLYVLEDLVARGLLEKTDREKEYKLSKEGERQAWKLSIARRLR